jgi:U32 family peptidase
MKKPELLSPAGSLDKLKFAVSYGADAVYLAGQKFGLRSAAENFTPDELEEGIAFAHARGAHVYVVINGFLHDRDLEELPAFLHLLEDLGADALIISDMGAISVADREVKIPIHLSTQASCLNASSGQLWKNHNIKRLIFGREVSIKQAGEIKRKTGLEVELFIHGSLCMAYSGNCTISNFTAGRDSNRGGCAQSCRFEYSLDYADGKKLPSTFFMSSKDLMGLETLPTFFEEEIDSVKVEGRMKSPLYTGMISKVYKEAIREVEKTATLPHNLVTHWSEELAKVPHREYSEANLLEPAGQDTVFNKSNSSGRPQFDFVGMVQAVKTGQYILADVRTSFQPGDAVELVPFEGPAQLCDTRELKTSLGDPVTDLKVNSLVRLPYIEGAHPHQFLRKVSLKR